MGKRAAILLILTLLCCLLLTACGGGGETAGESTTASVTEVTTTAETAPPDVAINGYTVVRAENADEATVQRVTELFQSMREMGEAGLKISDDFIGRDKEPDPNATEILCGSTNRPETAKALAALPGYYDYSVGLVDNKLCLAANDETGLADATDYFLAHLEMREGTLYYTGGQYVGRRDYALADATIGGKAVKEYTIVYGKGDEGAARVAEKLSFFFAEKTGVKVPIVEDTKAQGAGEILIGKTARAASVDPATLEKNGYVIRENGGTLVLSANNSSGYNGIMSEMETMMSENTLSAGVEKAGIYVGEGLDGGRVMFVGNSFLYYGYCTTTKNKIIYDDKGYFQQVAQAMGDDVTVTAITYGGKGFKSLYSILIENHPNHYGKGADKMDEFYDQDYVILQQEGSNADSTLSMARQIMKLFPPETKFCFFMHHHSVQKDHEKVISAAETLRDEDGVLYIPAGHLMYDIWTKQTKVPGATQTYNKNSFVVNHSDSHHPNYLNGYITALSCYYAITGKTIVDCPHDFVRTTKEYYTKATSNYDKILASEADMKGIKQLVEEYVVKYN